MESKKNNGGAAVNCSYFQMPLHYPRYSKKDYEDMPEWKLDRLLMEYGLPAMGDLAYKREYAMGAFLWPDIVPPRDFSTTTTTTAKSSVVGGARPLKKKI